MISCICLIDLRVNVCCAALFDIFWSLHEILSRFIQINVDRQEYDDLAEKATALGVSEDKWLPRCDIKKCIRKASEDKVSDQLVMSCICLIDLLLLVDCCCCAVFFHCCRVLMKETCDWQNFDSLMQELMALCISEDDSVQKGALGLNPAGAESRQ